MRIAVFHNLPSGGAKRALLEQVRELRRRQHVLDEYTLSTADLEFLPLDGLTSHTHVEPFEWKPLSRIKVRGLGPFVHLYANGKNLRRLAAAQRRLTKLINERQYDLVLLADCGFTLAPFALRSLYLPTVFYAHSVMLPYQESQWQGEGHSATTSRVTSLITLPQRVHHDLVYGINRRNAWHATSLLTNSRYSAGILSQQYRRSVNVVRYGVDTKAFAPAGGQRGAYVLSVGSLLPHKGHDLLVDAIGLIPSKSRPPFVIAAGSGSPEYEEDLRVHANGAGVELSIRRSVNTRDLAGLYSGARVLLAAAPREWLGLSPLEAMACGTPVLAANCGGYVETVRDGQTGLLVPRTAEAFAQALAHLLCNADGADKMGRAGRRYVETEWTWSHAGDQLDAALESAVLGQEAAL